MNKNYLNAVIINTFLESLNNPALPVKGAHEVFVDIETNKFTNPTVEESIKELGFVWSEAYVEDILNRNRRTVPFTAQDILDADNAGIDILVFKSCINDSIQKAESAIEDVSGLRIEKAKKGSPEYDEWLRKYREKRHGKADPEVAKEILTKKLKEEDISAKVSKMSVEEERKELQCLVDSGKIQVYFDGPKDDRIGAVEFTKDDLGDDFDYTVALANSALKNANIFSDEEDRVKDGKYTAEMNDIELRGTKVFGKDFNFSESPSSIESKKNEKAFRDHFGNEKADKILKRIDEKIKQAQINDLTGDDYEGYEAVSLKNLGITSAEDKQALEKMLSNLRDKNNHVDSWKGFGSYVSFKIEGDKLNISYHEIV